MHTVKKRLDFNKQSLKHIKTNWGDLYTHRHRIDEINVVSVWFLHKWQTEQWNKQKFSKYKQLHDWIAFNPSGAETRIFLENATKANRKLWIWEGKRSFSRLSEPFQFWEIIGNHLLNWAQYRINLGIILHTPRQRPHLSLQSINELNTEVAH